MASLDCIATKAMSTNATYATPPMNATLKSTTAGRPVRLSPRVAFYLVASITLTFLAGSSAPTPLYALYQTQWGFSSTMLTVVFGVYAIAVLSSLLVVGRLSDHVGRRPVLIVAALMQAFAMVILATAHGLPDLLIGRVVQGLSAGAALAAVGAGLLDLDKSRGALANAVAPMMGTAIGGVLAGLMVQYLPAPLHLVYAFLAAVFIAQAIGVFFIEETANQRAGALASLKPTIALPSNVRGAMLIAVPALIAVWTLGGFYASLGPRLVKHLAGSNSILLGGVALFVLAGSGALAVLLLHLHDAQRLMRVADRRCRRRAGRRQRELDAVVPDRNRDCRRGLRDRLPGRVAQRDRFDRAATARRRVVGAVRRVVPRAGRAGHRSRLSPRAARRHRGDRARPRRDHRGTRGARVDRNIPSSLIDSRAVGLLSPARPCDCLAAPAPSRAPNDRTRPCRSPRRPASTERLPPSAAATGPAYARPAARDRGPSDAG
jgi:MFS family permease